MDSSKRLQQLVESLEYYINSNRPRDAGDLALFNHINNTTVNDYYKIRFPSKVPETPFISSIVTFSQQSCS